MQKFYFSGGILLMIWHSAELGQLLNELDTDEKSGLTAEEAARRLAKYGKNQLAQTKKKSIIQKFLDQFKDYMIIILLIAAAISLVTSILSNEGADWLEPIIIVAIVVLNALLGVIQENKAESALEALKSMAAPSAKVIRNSALSVIRADEIVPGDIIVLEAGDYIPADARLISSSMMRCEESALTGESVSSEKYADAVLTDITAIGDRTNMVFAGCSVAYGNGVAAVTGTGMSTEMGKIANMLKGEDTVTPLQHKMAELGKTLGKAALAICAVIFVLGLVFRDSSISLIDSFVNIFMTAVSLAVAAIPEGLPAIVTIVLALGVQRMIKRNAIIRNLPAVETLGSASVICSDKTGTLTQNRMTMVMLFDKGGFTNLTNENCEISASAAELLRTGAICCDADVHEDNGERVAIGDPTEIAIIDACEKYVSLNKNDVINMYPRLSAIPFDSDRKLMTTVNIIDGKTYAIVKGAPDILLPRCVGDGIENGKKANIAMSSQALRVLAVAVKPIDDVSLTTNPTSDALENGLTFVGLMGMIDPPRPEAVPAVEKCKKAGIRTVMITGDNAATAAAIGKQIGIISDESGVLTGDKLAQMTDDELCEKVEQYSVYGRVSPEDKIRIVRAWQKKGHVVAMTGDGVNDAPALKAADIGCAMGITGTDVAKGAADMTLTDDNFATIISAVEEGRGIYANIKKAVQFLLSCNFGEIISVFFSMLFWHVSPLSALQLLWVNLVTDGLPALALGVEPVEKDIMEQPPRKKDESLFANGLGIGAVYQGIMIGALTLIAYAIGNAVSPDTAKTMAFLTLAFSQLFHSFNARSNNSLFKVGLFKNKWIIGAFAVSALLMAAVVFTPASVVFGLSALTGKQIASVVLLSVAPLFICEIVKLITGIVKKIRNKKGA